MVIIIGKLSYRILKEDENILFKLIDAISPLFYIMSVYYLFLIVFFYFILFFFENYKEIKIKEDALKTLTLISKKYPLDVIYFEYIRYCYKLFDSSYDSNAVEDKKIYLFIL